MSESGQRETIISDLCQQVRRAQDHTAYLRRRIGMLEVENARLREAIQTVLADGAATRSSEGVNDD